MKSRPRARRYAYQIPEFPILYVIANREEATFYVDGSDHRFHSVGRLMDRHARLVESKLVSDRPGSVTSSGALGGVHHSLGRRVSQHEMTMRRFARQVARELIAARKRGTYGGLILVAEPRFLGLLRRSLDTPTRGFVLHEVDHEYKHGSELELRRRVLRSVREAA